MANRGGRQRERASLTWITHLLGSLPPPFTEGLWFSPLILDFKSGQSLINTEEENSRCECITHRLGLSSIIFTSIIFYTCQHTVSLSFLSSSPSSSSSPLSLNLWRNPVAMSLSFSVAELAPALRRVFLCECCHLLHIHTELEYVAADVSLIYLRGCVRLAHHKSLSRLPCAHLSVRDPKRA